MVIIPVAREVSFQGFLFKLRQRHLRLSCLMSSLNHGILEIERTIYHSPCFKRGKLVQNVTKGHVKAVSKCINVVLVCACTNHRRGNIS